MKILALLYHSIEIRRRDIKKTSIRNLNFHQH